MPSHARRRRRRPLRALGTTALVTVVVAIVVTAVVGLAGRSDDAADDPSEAATAPPPSAAATTEPPSAAPAAPPADDACYLLADDALGAAHDDSPAVGCSQDHTSQTYLVGELAEEDLGRADADGAVDADVLAGRAAARCREALPDHLGTDARTLATVRLRPAWFVPSADDLDRGARWLRCDVVALREESRLARLPERTAGMLETAERRERWTTCAQGSLATLQAGRGQRMCALPHDWRTVGTRRVGADDAAYPGDEAARGRVLARCEEQVRAYVDDPTAEVTVGWLPPTRAQWDGEGQRFGLCWARTQ